MIKLADSEPFGRGSHRSVYRHPDRDDRCLKVMTEDWHQCERWKKASWLSRTFRPRRYFHENERELHFSEDLRKRVGDRAWKHVAQAYRVVETDLGPALEVDLITDADGEISLSLKQYLWENGLTDECAEAIKGFWQGLDENWIFVQGRPDNVSISRLESGDLRIRAIDGLGLPQLLPLAKFLPHAKRRMLTKRREKQERVIADLLKTRASGGELKTASGFRID